MTGSTGEYRLYTGLADWWPLISPVTEYAAEAEYLAAVFGSAGTSIRQVLDLGSGGGHVAAHLTAAGLILTLVDRSEQMLAVSRRLNPQCVHELGDMRTVRLGRAFDAVLVHDAIDYVTSAEELRQVIGTAFGHCRPGGIAVFVPGYTEETFRPGRGGGGSGDETGRHGSFREWRTDPVPADGWIAVEYEFVLREADGSVQVVRETHRLGAFSRATWLRLLKGAGFEPQRPTVAAAGPLASGRRPDNLFVGRRPVS